MTPPDNKPVNLAGAARKGDPGLIFAQPCDPVGGMTRPHRFEMLRRNPWGCRPESANKPQLSPVIRETWGSTREDTRARWAALLGPMPPPSPLPARVEGEWIEPDHRRLHISYETEPGAPTEAFVLLPPGNPPDTGWPGMVVFHATSDNHIHQAAGLADRPTRHLGLHLVRRGYAVICPKCFIYGYRGKTWTDATEELEAQHPGLTGMGKMLWDGIRATDMLSAMPEVDASRLGCLGHSLGAKETLYLAAFDGRIRAAVSCEGGIGLGMSNWEAPWYLNGRPAAIPPGMDHHELVALAAPRAFLLIGGGDADGPHSWPWVEAALPAYRASGAEDRVGLLLHRSGHDFPDATRTEAFAWLDHWMAAGER